MTTPTRSLRWRDGVFPVGSFREGEEKVEGKVAWRGGDIVIQMKSREGEGRLHTRGVSEQVGENGVSCRCRERREEKGRTKGYG
jgi:hypothetical protein